MGLSRGSLPNSRSYANEVRERQRSEDRLKLLTDLLIPATELKPRCLGRIERRAPGRRFSRMPFNAGHQRYN